MAGALIRVLGKTYFDHSTLAASTTSERIVAAGINVSAYR